METNELINFYSSLNIFVKLLKDAIGLKEITNFKLIENEDKIGIILQRGSRDLLLGTIDKIGEDTMRIIYAYIASKYQNIMEIGATSEYKNGEITFFLAPVIGDKSLIEFVSYSDYNQKWFREEIENSTKQKGLS